MLVSLWLLIQPQVDAWDMLELTICLFTAVADNKRAGVADI